MGHGFVATCCHATRHLRHCFLASVFAAACLGIRSCVYGSFLSDCNAATCLTRDMAPPIGVLHCLGFLVRSSSCCPAGTPVIVHWLHLVAQSNHELCRIYADGCKHFGSVLICRGFCPIFRALPISETINQAAPRLGRATASVKCGRRSFHRRIVRRQMEAENKADSSESASAANFF